MPDKPGCPLALSTNPAMELMLTIEPPPIFITYSAAYFVPRKPGLVDGDDPALHPIRIAD